MAIKLSDLIVEVQIPATGQVFKYVPSEHDNGVAILVRLAGHGLKQKCVDTLARGKDEPALSDSEKESRVLASYAKICEGEWSTRDRLSEGLKTFRQMVLKAVKKDGVKAGDLGSTYDMVEEVALGMGIGADALKKARLTCEGIDEMDLEIDLEV